MSEIKKSSTTVVSEIVGMKNKYYILDNNDIMVVLSSKSWAKVEEIKDLSGNDCVRLVMENGKAEYFRKSDLVNGEVNPLDRHEIKKRKNEKSVGMYQNGVLIETFHNVNVASKEMCISQSSIYNCCNNIRYSKSAGGYEWKYEQ